MKFQVFKDGQPLKTFELCGAYLFGTDGIAVRHAKIKFKNGVIDCQKPTQETAGLALLWPVNESQSILLPTTCLPERERPYNLNVEIARAKLMQIVSKREDWSFFSDIEGLVESPKEAQKLFIHAIQNIADAPTASKLADQALKQACDFSEKLANKQAQLLFDARCKSRGFGRGCLGCTIEPGQIHNPKYINKLMELFGFVTIPVNWAQIESKKGLYDFSALDTCVNVLARRKLAIAAGPLLCFSKQYLPKWLMHKPMSFGKIRDAAYQFLSEVVDRYAGSVRAWRVISGLNIYNHFGFSFEQVLEMTRASNMAVKQTSDRAIRIIEVSNPWGEYYSTVPHTIPPLVYLDMVAQSGINFNAFGLQMRFGKNQDGMLPKDMMQISAVLDYFANLGKPLYISDVEVPGQSADSTKAGKPDNLFGSWNQQQQGQWIEQFYKIALSKPFVDCVSYFNFADRRDSIIAGSGLLTENLSYKKTFQKLKQLRELIYNR